MRETILFGLTFLFVLVIYEIFIVSKTKRRKAKGKKINKEPMEISYLVDTYRLDIKKVNYNKLLQIISLVSSFDIALVVTIVANINNYFQEIIIGFVCILISIFTSYHLVYLFYKKKGMIKND